MVALSNLDFQLHDFAARAPQKRSRADCMACWFVRMLFVAWLAFWLTVGGVVAWNYLPGRGAVLDFLSPTAAQARDSGWAALSEGRP
ncbi:MAG: hypothetical protein Q4615_04870 [Paracoccus aminovorans]|nr:hypothetical protein [Paracoccus aminovorans]